MTKSAIDVSIVKTLEELECAYDIRREVFMAEGGEPEDEQFDGNDLCSVHLIARWNERICGTMRIRIISMDEGGTVIWERLSVLKEAREKNPWIFRSLLLNAKRYTEMMGLKTVIGIVEDPKLMRFWKLYGFKPTGEEPLNYRGHEYVPIKLSLETIKGKVKVREEVSLRQAVRAFPDVFAQAQG
ncbi:hypothetical protein WH96_05695 [Kiloniella spongiae]|uniref:N-acetyltransferase domain-containing protein n=1 Tax=Kiloniella spongiae TaxID=1489064 RepID=A0A0H2MYH0_9PROT|nr:N-acetyltransferase [Kiloniella spongiae]KLN61785.1 hypothetical protein WH96_05695 [Kiloniella spongiae]